MLECRPSVPFFDELLEKTIEKVAFIVRNLMCTQADFIENENGDNGVLNDGGLAPYFVMSKLQPIVIVNLKKKRVEKESV